MSERTSETVEVQSNAAATLCSASECCGAEASGQDVVDVNAGSDNSTDGAEVPPAADSSAVEDSEEDEALARVLKESEEDARRDHEARQEAAAREAADEEEAIRLSEEEFKIAEAQAAAKADADLQSALEASKEISCVPLLKAEADLQAALQLSKVESHVSTQASEYVVQWATPSKCKMANAELDLSTDPSLLIFGAAGRMFAASTSSFGAASTSTEISSGF